MPDQGPNIIRAGISGCGPDCFEDSISGASFGPAVFMILVALVIIGLPGLAFQIISGASVFLALLIFIVLVRGISFLMLRLLHGLVFVLQIKNIARASAKDDAH